MKNKDINVTFKSDGTIEITGTGFVGKECQILEELAKQMGAIVKHTPTAEAYQTVKKENHQSMKG